MRGIITCGLHIKIPKCSDYTIIMTCMQIDVPIQNCDKFKWYIHHDVDAGIRAN